VLAKIFTTMLGIPVRMVSYGGSQHNISVLISREHKEKTLQLLNKGLFGM
jgi:aspartate kinase